MIDETNTTAQQARTEYKAVRAQRNAQRLAEDSRTCLLENAEDHAACARLQEVANETYRFARALLGAE